MYHVHMSYIIHHTYLPALGLGGVERGLTAPPDRGVGVALPQAHTVRAGVAAAGLAREHRMLVVCVQSRHAPAQRSRQARRCRMVPGTR